jgi:hypothetical protein
MVSPRQYRCQPANSERLAFRYVKGNTMAREGDAESRVPLSEPLKVRFCVVSKSEHVSVLLGKARSLLDQLAA